MFASDNNITSLEQTHSCTVCVFTIWSIIRVL